jgi:hypothetical protein
MANALSRARSGAWARCESRGWKPARASLIWRRRQGFDAMGRQEGVEFPPWGIENVARIPNAHARRGHGWGPIRRRRRRRVALGHKEIDPVLFLAAWGRGKAILGPQAPVGL